MDPPPLLEGTSATVQVIPYFDDHDGSYVGIVLVKERFRVSRRGGVTRCGDAEIRIADEFWFPDAPETSSIKFPSDLCLRKPSTDVVVAGAAVAPYAKPVRELDVFLKAGSIQKALRVFGPRAWYRAGPGRLSLTEPLPFETMPLQWELAWGGSDYVTDPDNPLEEPRNPNGRGVVRDADTLEGALAPCIEDPNDLVRSHRSRPAPVGVGAIGRSWDPRRRYAGTFDDEWMEERMPLLPLDFDPRFNQVAPPDQVTREPLRGGERVELVNMHEEGPVAFDVPRLRFFVGVETLDGMTEHPPQLDTLLLRPGERTFEMTWRSVVPLPRNSSRLKHVQVHEKQLV